MNTIGKHSRRHHGSQIPRGPTHIAVDVRAALVPRRTIMAPAAGIRIQVQLRTIRGVPGDRQAPHRATPVAVADRDHPTDPVPINPEAPPLTRRTPDRAVRLQTATVGVEGKFRLGFNSPTKPPFCITH